MTPSPENQRRHGAAAAVGDRRQRRRRRRGHRLGRAAARAGRRARRRRAAGRRRAGLPRAAGRGRPSTSRPGSQLARLLVQLEEHEQAIDVLGDGLRNAPDQTEFLVLRGGILPTSARTRSRTPTCDAFCGCTRRTRPPTSSSAACSGAAASSREAADLFQRALEFQPDSARTCYYLGDALNQAGDLAGARARAAAGPRARPARRQDPPSAGPSPRPARPARRGPRDVSSVHGSWPARDPGRRRGSRHGRRWTRCSARPTRRWRRSAPRPSGWTSSAANGSRSSGAPPRRSRPARPS